MTRAYARLVGLIEIIVDVYSLHDVIHALIDVCYRKAEVADVKIGKNWNAIAQAMTPIEVVSRHVKAHERPTSMGGADLRREVEALLAKKG